MTTRLLTSDASPGNAQPDAIIVGILQGAQGPELAPGAEPVNEALGGTLLAAAAALGATGKAEQTTKIATGPLLAAASDDGRPLAPVIVAVGLGRAAADDAGQIGAPEFSSEALRRAAGAAVRAAVQQPAKPVRNDDLQPGQDGAVYRIAMALPSRDDAEAEAVALGGLLGGYAFSRYRTTVPAPPSVELTLAGDGAPAGAAGRRAQSVADAVTLVRDLVNTGPSDLFPATLAGEAERVAAERGLDVEVLDEKALAEGGFGGILAVGQGSVHTPRLIRLSYRHPGATKTVVFAGKGITFDSGGLSLKPAKSMEHMKSDMAGAAAVLGAMQVIADLAPPVNVVGYLAAAENMPGGARAAAGRHHHDLRRQDRRGAEHRRRGTAGAGRRHRAVRRRLARPGGGRGHADRCAVGRARPAHRGRHGQRRRGPGRDRGGVAPRGRAVLADAAAGGTPRRARL